MFDRRMALEGAMSLTWSAPAALWLLLGVPLVWLARPGGADQLQSAAAALQSRALAAARRARARPGAAGDLELLAHQSVVYVVDVSHSVASQAIDDGGGADRRAEPRAAAGALAHRRLRRRRGHARRSTDGAAAAREDARSSATRRRCARRGATDLEAALDAARGELAPGHVPRIVLFTDGHPTGATPARRSRTWRRSGFRSPSSRWRLASIGDTWVDAFDLPRRHHRPARSLDATVDDRQPAQRPGEVELRLKLRTGGPRVGSPRQTACSRESRRVRQGPDRRRRRRSTSTRRARTRSRRR